MEEIELNIWTSIIAIIPQLIIIVACFFYMIKKMSIEGILLLAGSIVGFLIIIFHTIIFPYLIRENIIDPLHGSFKIMLIIEPISFIFSLAFSVGFFILIINSLKQKDLSAMAE